MLELEMNKKKTKDKKHKLISKRCYKGFSQANFNMDLAAQPWENLAGINSVDEMVEIYTTLVEDVLNKHAPVKLIKQYSNYQSGMSKQTRQKMYARDQARKNKSPEYRTLRNEVVKLIKKTKEKEQQKP